LRCAKVLDPEALVKISAVGTEIETDDHLLLFKMRLEPRVVSVLDVATQAQDDTRAGG
jgi:hypothetical protein